MEGTTEKFNEGSNPSEVSEATLVETEKKLGQEVRDIEDNNKALKNLIVELDKKKSISSISEA